VEATLSPSLSIVANKRIAGKAEKSRGFELLIAIIIMMTPNRMLNVNKKSSRNDGRGRTSMEIISKTIAGIPRPESSIFDMS
jgi:hypothetical protein